MNLATAIEELRAHAETHPWNPLAMKLPEYRNFEHEGLIFRVALSRLELPRQIQISPTGERVPKGHHVYMLSVCKLSAVPDATGACLPTEEEAEDVARAFFPGGFHEMPPRHDVLRGSRKYFAVL